MSDIHGGFFEGMVETRDMNTPIDTSNIDQSALLNDKLAKVSIKLLT